MEVEKHDLVSKYSETLHIDSAVTFCFHCLTGLEYLHARPTLGERDKELYLGLS